MTAIIKQLEEILGAYSPRIYGPKYVWQLSGLYDLSFYQKMSGRCVIELRHVFEDECIVTVECGESDVIERTKILVRSAMNTYQLELQDLQKIYNRFPA